MEKRGLEDLDLLDDFLFGTMLSYPEIGEKFIRELLKIIFGREFGTLTIIPQKGYHTTEENAVTENLRNIHEMVKLVKQDEEVSLQYMKIFEREEMLIQQGIEKGRIEEHVNTERERRRADHEKTRADQLEKELKRLKEKIREKEKSVDGR